MVQGRDERTGNKNELKIREVWPNQSGSKKNIGQVVIVDKKGLKTSSIDCSG